MGFVRKFHWCTQRGSQFINNSLYWNCYCLWLEQNKLLCYVNELKKIFDIIPHINFLMNPSMHINIRS